MYWVAPLVQAPASGPTLTAAAAATCLPTSALYTLDAGYFDAPGRTLRIVAAGRISCVVTTPGTARFDVRLGGTVMFDTLAMPLNVVAKTNENWRLVMELVCISTGSAAQLRGSGEFTSQALIGGPGNAVAGAGAFVVPYNSPIATSGNTFNATAAQLVDMFFTQTVGTGSLTLDQYALYG